MKKTLIGILVLFTVLASASVYAGQEKLGSFYIGPFALNQANWTGQMDSQLFSAMQNIPDEARLEVNGHTDNSGRLAFNEKLADKRAKLVAGKISKLRPKVRIAAVTGQIYQAGANDIDYRMARIDVHVPEGWSVSNKELANRLKEGLAVITEEQSRQRQSINELCELSRETSQEVKGIKRKLNVVGSSNQAAVEKLGDLSKLIAYIVLAIFILLVFAFFMIRRNQRKSETKIVDAFNNSIVDVKTIAVDYESEIFIVTVKRKQDGFWHSPFKSSSGQDIYRESWKGIKKSVKDSVKSTNEIFQKQKKDLIAAGKIKVKEKE